MCLVLMHAILQCHLNVMKIASYVIWELICMDVGWEIFANQVTFLALMFAQIQCPQHVMATALYVTWEGTQMDVG